MDKKQKQLESTNLKPIIVNGLFLVIGGLLGFFGTQANANAQVTAAQEAAKAQITSAAINVYGPIFTTQTAEAKITPIATPAAPSLTVSPSSGISIPISNVKVDGKIIGDSFEVGNSRVGEFELTSTQKEGGWSSWDDYLLFFWDSPGNFPDLDQLPMRGIQTTISVSPNETRYAQELVYCFYSLRYNGHSYSSADQYIPFNQPVTLVWDFAGRLAYYDYGLSDEHQQILGDAMEILLTTEDMGFSDFYKRNGELWQYLKLVDNSYKPNTVERLSVLCSVSAGEEYRGAAPGKQFVFRGSVTFGDVIVFPYEMPKR